VFEGPTQLSCTGKHMDYWMEDNVYSEMTRRYLIIVTRYDRVRIRRRLSLTDTRGTDGWRTNICAYFDVYVYI